MTIWRHNVDEMALNPNRPLDPATVRKAINGQSHNQRLLIQRLRALEERPPGADAEARHAIDEIREFNTETVEHVHALEARNESLGQDIGNIFDNQRQISLLITQHELTYNRLDRRIGYLIHAIAEVFGGVMNIDPHVIIQQVSAHISVEDAQIEDGIPPEVFNQPTALQMLAATVAPVAEPVAVVVEPDVAEDVAVVPDVVEDVGPAYDDVPLDDNDFLT